MKNKLQEIIIYHNPRCSKSRAGLTLLLNNNINPIVRKYLDNPFTAKELKALLVKLNMPASDIVRVKEQVFISRFRGKSFTDDEWIKILLEFPRLIKRPIIAKSYKAVIGDPVENIAEFLKISLV